MSNSITIFSGRLRKAYNDKKKLIKESGGKYSKEEFAKNVYGVGTDGKVHVDRVNKWFQGKNFPSPDLIPEIAKELDCDIAYLFGEIECKHCKEQQITDITGLGEEACEKLINLNDGNTEMLDGIIKNRTFKELLTNIYHFTHSANKSVEITDIVFPDIQHNNDDDSLASSIYKIKSTDIFGNILDDLYDDYFPAMVNARITTFIEVFIELMTAKRNIENEKPFTIKSNLSGKILYQSPKQNTDELSNNINKIIEEILFLKKEYLDLILSTKNSTYIDFFNSIPDTIEGMYKYYDNII